MMNLRHKGKGLSLHCIVNSYTSHLQIEKDGTDTTLQNEVSSGSPFRWSPNQYGRRVKAIHSGDITCARLALMSTLGSKSGVPLLLFGTRGSVSERLDPMKTGSGWTST